MHGAAEADEGSSTFKLRLVAIFVILAAGLLGVFPPLIGSWLSSHNSIAARVVRAASGGIILALALIHIIPESFEQLEGKAGALPLGGMMVMCGLLAMLVLEYITTYVSLNSHPSSRQHKHSHGAALLPTSHQHGSAAGDGAAAPTAAPESPVHAHGASESCNKLCKTGAGPAAAQVVSTPTTAAGDHVHMKVDGAHRHAHQHSSHATDPSAHAAVDHLVPSLAHSHGCRQQPACHSTAVKQQVVCVTMELGCVFHSVVLGLALGVMASAPDMVLMLLVVLAVHQLVEGIALGSVLAATQRMSQHKKYVLAGVYAVTLPAGIAAGLLASNSYDPASAVAVLVQGVANGLSGGMLLCVSLFSLLAAELSQHDLLHRPLLAVGLLAAVLAGAAVMCVLGLWA